MLPNILPLDTTPPPPASRRRGCPTTWPAHQRCSYVLPLQRLYDGPYAVVRRSLQHFTLRIGDKEDKVSTLRLKPCTDPAALPALPRVWGRPPATVRFRDFPPPGTAAARRVHFAPELPAEPRREPFSPGMPPGVFARPAVVLDHIAARPARRRRAPSRLDLEAWGEPCRGSPRDDLRGLRICYAASLQFTLRSHVLHTHVF